MAAIPCSDYFTEDIGTVPVRIKRTNPDSIKDRWTPFVASFDILPSPKDDEATGELIDWSLWDTPASHSAQYVDERGNDLIVVAIVDRVYYFDWDRYADEWAPNTFAPIYRMLRTGPVPSNSDASQNGYALDVWKRFREFAFALKDEPQAGDDSKWRVSVAEWDAEEANWKVTLRHAARRMRVPVVARGRTFNVRLEHSANEPVRIEHWQAKWNMLGRRIPNSKRTV